MRTFKFFQLLDIALVSTWIVKQLRQGRRKPASRNLDSYYFDEYATETFIFTSTPTSSFIGQITYIDSETSEIDIEHISGTYVFDETSSKLHITDTEEGYTMTYNISISKNELTLTDPEDSEYTVAFHKK